MSVEQEPLDPEHLADRVRAGDTAAEDELVRSYGPRLLRLLRLWMRDDDAAREILNDSLFAVVRALRDGRVREPRHLASFIWGTAKNLTRTFRRTRARRPVHEELSPESAAYDPRLEMAEADRRAQLREAIARLEPTDRTILEMALVGNQSLAEIGERLGLSHDAARARKSRALKRLAERVRGHDPASGGHQ
jgi:RNA polymerase sigma-70 factor (ECF subfamily)